MEAEMSGVMQGVARGHSVLSLNVSRNMTNVKPKHLPSVMESIVQLIQDEETVLQKLNLSDCKLKAEINNVITLKHFDKNVIISPKKTQSFRSFKRALKDFKLTLEENSS